jgi:hypothetical protein
MAILIIFLCPTLVVRPSPYNSLRAFLIFMEPWKNTSLTTLEGELWECMPGSEKNYMVSNLGRVKSLARSWFARRGTPSIKTRILRQTLNPNGYCTISLANKKCYTVHRLVGIAFISNPLNKPNINHKNGIRCDARAENLEWCTQSENIIHSYENGFQISNWKGKLGHLHCQARSIICVETKKQYGSIIDAANEMNLHASHISAVCNKQRTTTGGYTFRFIDLP